MKLKPWMQCAHDALDKSISIWAERRNRALPSRFMQGSDKDRLKGRASHSALAQASITYGSLADDEARRAAGRAMIALLVAFLMSSRGQRKRYFLATFCWDAGVVATQPPFQIDLKAMRIKVYKALHKLGLSAVCVVEVVALRKSKHNDEVLLVHVHAVCWTGDKRFKPVVAGRALSALASFSNGFGAPSVTFQSRAMSANRFKDKSAPRYKHLFARLHKDQTKRSIAWLGYYLFQAPAWVKQLIPKKQRTDGFAMRSNSQNYSPAIAHALHQLLTTIMVTDAVFGVGEGKHVTRPWGIAYRKALAHLSELGSKSRKRWR